MTVVNPDQLLVAATTTHKREFERLCELLEKSEIDFVGEKVRILADSEALTIYRTFVSESDLRSARKLSAEARATTIPFDIISNGH